jgi:hypothetical protein
MENESSSHTLVDLVRSSLERGGEFPLNVQIAVDPHHHAERWILELLSQHSHRWKNAHIWLHPHSLGVLLGAKGNLPMLDSLTLSSGTDIDYRYADDVFEIAPRLKTVTLIGWPSGGPALPWGQLLHVTYENGESSKFSLATLPLLSPHACCELAVNASTISIPLELQPVTSDASTLLIRFTSQFDPMRTWEILGIILRCLTLPRLTALRFIHRPNAPPPLWNHTHFREFASRSRLRTTLTQLELYVVIQEHELVGSLAALPLLEELRLWDSAGAGGEVITDSLLRQLTWRSGETNLVPRLSTLGLTTTIAFRDNSLMELVTSRADPGRSENGPFVVMVLLYARCRREFSSEFVAQLAELEEGGDLIFALGRI